jgi:hypothetical protein
MWKFGLVAVLILTALCGIGWWWWNHIHPPGPDCLMLSHEKTSGIDFSFTIDKVKFLQATLGLTDKDIRDFDDLLKDYGAKYETICKDYSVLHVVTSGEYNCRRDNMDKTLDSIRALREVLGKSSGDVANATAKKYIESILDAVHGSFTSGCGASLRIDPNKIHISREASHTITVSNVGNRDVIFGVTGIPQCLLPDPRTGGLSRGESRNITLWRTYYAVPSDSFTFTIEDNFNSHIPVEVTGANNLPSPGAMASDLKSQIGRPPTLQDALTFINAKGRKPSAGTYITAAAILSSAGNYADALSAIQLAEGINPEIKSEAAIQLETGILQLASGDSPDALVRLRAAESSSDSRIANTARWYSGITFLKSGQTNEAASYICGDKGPAFPDLEMTAPVGARASHDLELARTSKDCQGKVARIGADIRRVPKGKMLIREREENLD